MKTTVVDFQVTGEEKIRCEGCESRIAAALGRLPGVERVQASAETQRVEVAIDPSAVGADKVREKLEQLGYQVGRR
ncbi:MAG: heavy-metal-associated domain-containing protein [Lautropia sp.]|nr:heavy-metal-associated domain-containing protein [Lautropia sp.]